MCHYYLLTCIKLDEVPDHRHRIAAAQLGDAHYLLTFLYTSRPAAAGPGLRPLRLCRPLRTGLAPAGPVAQADDGLCPARDPRADSETATPPAG